MPREKQKVFRFIVRQSDFKKSSWSDHPKKVCVLVAQKREGVAMRDSKDRKKCKTTLYFSQPEWQAFV